MDERTLIEQLNDALEATLAGRPTEVSLLEPSLTELLVIAADLRELPDPRFMQDLKARLLPDFKEDEMSTMTLPKVQPGYHTITPYLIVSGAAELMVFLKEAFGGEEILRVPAPGGGIMHAEMRIGDSMVELADGNDQWKPRQSAIHLYVDDADATYQRAVAAGATSLQAPVDQFYGDREAAVQDRWGNHWYIATHQDPAAKPIPKGFRTVTPYLLVRGAEPMIGFLKEAFGATVIDGPNVGEDGRIMHAALRIGDSVVELGEAHGKWEPKPCAIHLYVADADAVYERTLRAGASSLLPPEDKPYGERGAAVDDPFGNQWYIATPL